MGEQERQGEDKDGAVIEEAGRALFRLGRVFSRLPRRDLLEVVAAAGREAELSAILTSTLLI